jgi:hypothetical protein
MLIHYSARFSKGLITLSLLFCVTAAPAQTITNAFAQLKNHILGVTNLTDSEISSQAAAIQSSIQQVGESAGALAGALDLVTTYDAKIGALFTTPDTKKGFPRDASKNVLAHAMLAVQQGILDYAYTPANLAAQARLLNGAKFGTAVYFPGDVSPPADARTGYAVPIKATLPVTWGSPALFETNAARRPTGCYLAPGSIASVNVPAALVNKGFAIRVGAHSWDLKDKPVIKRLDRVSLVYPITSTTTRIANPLGGGIYIEVPYKSDLGIVTVGITNVVRSPFFSATSFHKTTLEEWMKTERTQPGAWADFESDKFMMQVPRSWIYNYSNPVTVMQGWDQAMDAVSDLMGRPRVRSKTVLYMQVDVLYRGKANFPGYPQSNDPYNPNDVENGNKKHHFITGPVDSPSATLHELGHAQSFTKFTGETEAVVNLMYVAAMNQKFGMSLDEALGRSVGNQAREKVSLPEAALTWILTDRFRAGQAMNDKDMKYQQRGYAKYAEIANLFGWGALSNFWHSVNVDYMHGIEYPINTDPTDSRILRMSRAAGVDLRPLIHFWGVHPQDPAKLKQEIESAGLKPSLAIYNRFKYYQTVVPTNQVQFNEHYDLFKSAVSDTVDGPWYKEMQTHYTPEMGQATVRAVQAIIDLYFPDGPPAASGGPASKARLGAAAP